MKIKHDKENSRFTMDIDGQTAKVDYKMKNGKMHLVYSEVPYNLRSNGIGKELVERTFQKLTEEGYQAVAICSYIRAVALKSPKWSDIID
ncbi:N-acetyltransferase [Flavobacteriaceae bacterium F89]|uniref:N-acetyltransferase n=1 Tax=Cerina litoralis TaxID=2874477 RepID=A0AAE3EX44_9FLAO|nr:GNAT family N-acetyltransferase [Cerina litoralis]MCG2462710.1 N-acetyltransferase [Cerina litoralis]